MNEFDWDVLADEMGVPYFEATAIRNIFNWLSTRNINDLRRAIEWIERRLRSKRMAKGNAALRLRSDHFDDEFQKLVGIYEVPPCEKDIITMVLRWVDECELLWAVDELKRLIDKKQTQEA